ncbi:MAG: RcnB family protein [Pseudomonadota bacterium]|nr:RcnB family protein [Pseudomonadota bacterium]
MKMTRIVCAVAAASLTFAGVSFAQEPPNDGRNAAANRLREQAGRQQAQQDRRGDNRSDRHVDNRSESRVDNGSDRRVDNRYDRRVDNRYDRHDDHRYDRHDGPGAGPDHNFYRGGRLPDEYRDRQYVVDDWRGHHLRAPPRGYHWVQAGGDYVLAAVATGVIVSILLNSH